MRARRACRNGKREINQFASPVGDFFSCININGGRLVMPIKILPPEEVPKSGRMQISDWRSQGDLCSEAFVIKSCHHHKISFDHDFLIQPVTGRNYGIAQSKAIPL